AAFDDASTGFVGAGAFPVSGGSAAGGGGLFVSILGEEILAPLAGIAGEIEDSVDAFISAERADVIDLSDFAAAFPDGSSFSPRIGEAVESAGRLFPFRFGRQLFA